MNIHRLVIPACLSYSAGCAAAVWTHATPYAVAVAATFAAVAAVYSLLTRQRMGPVLLLSLALLGLGRAAYDQTPPPDDISRLARRQAEVRLYGKVVSDPDIRSDRISFVFQAENATSYSRKEPYTGRVWISVTGAMLERLRDEGNSLEYGDYLVIKGTLRRPRGPKEPGGFSARDWLSRKRVFCSMWLDRPGSVAHTSYKDSPLYRNWATVSRNFLVERIQARLPHEQAGLVGGMLFGSYSLVSKDLIEDFTRSGTLHLLAASGFNCTLIVIIFWRILFMRIPFPRLGGLAVTKLLIVFYMLLVGGSPSIMRAGVGALLYLGALAAGRPSDMWSILFSTAFIILLAQPLSIADVGFQLSFAAVLAIIAFVPQMESLAGFFSRLGGIRKPALNIALAVPRHLTEVSVVTLAATLATYPILSHYFHRASLISLPANVAVAFIAEMLFTLTVTWCLLMWIPGVEWLLGGLVGILAGALARLVTFFGDLSFAEVQVSSPGGLMIFSYYLMLVAIWMLAETRKQEKSRPESDPFISQGEQKQ